ncbi:galactose oxidase [Gigaspora margarita]|uniref:Galactose oxidase n=2 Tax=Gigaspora margarita TaxID=4874 RepID=A0A8H4A0G5_GIGMA|nr:galactose oxidase [Gigaspora margarita]
MLLYNFVAFSLYIFICLLNFVFTSAFIPDKRYSHSSVFINKKLYFSGGYSRPGKVYTTNEFFYLDVSKSFTITDNGLMPWIDLTYTGGPQKASATVCTDEKNNDLFFIFGGYPYNSSFINQFDISKQQWINIISTGNAPTNRSSISCAKFNNGLISIFSGFNTTSIITNDLWIFNTLTLTWSLSNAADAPLFRWAYCAITLPDKNILYIGGKYDTNLYRPMNSLPLYNTKSDTWTTMSIFGPTPPDREFPSAVLTSDERIIIFGGYNNGTSFGDLWILDITKYQWSIGNILNPIVDLVLYRHTATLVDNYMIVAFGLFSENNMSSKIFMLDVSHKDSYRWVTEFTPNATTTTTTTISSNPISSNTISSDSKNVSLIIGAIIGAIIFLVIFVIAIILTLKFINKHNVLLKN